jgi:serine/threonine protein kinase
VLTLQLATDVAKGMAYLHGRPTDPVIHGDLKPSNLLMDDDGKVVISDFGLSKVSTLTLTTRPSSSGMSVTYTAPEILADPTSKRSASADVYAYGLVLFEIFTRELPFESAADVMAVVQYVLGGGRPRIAGAAFDELRVPREIVELMQVCWQQVPQARPTFAQVVETLKQLDDADA